MRLSAIGDVVMASSMIGALRAGHPGVRIAWRVQPECAPLLQHNPDLERVITWPRGRWAALFRGGRWLELAREVRRFRAELRDARFDTAIDLQGLLKSGVTAWLSGAPERIGLRSREGSRFLMTRVFGPGDDSRRIGSEYLHLARQLGLPTENFDMAVALSPDDRRFADELTAARGLAGGYLALTPFTTRPQKHWFESRWTELVNRFEETFGLPVVILGAQADRPAAERIARGTAAINLAGETSLTQAAAMISRSKLLVGVDTGLTHMGIAFGRPVLALFGATRPYLETGREEARVIYHPLPCSPCRRRPTCDGRYDCMQAIGVDEVLARAEALQAARGGEW